MKKHSTSLFFLLTIWNLVVLFDNTGGVVEGHVVSFHITNKCPFPIWPAVAPNAGHPVIADGGFFLPTGQTKQVHGPATWNGRFWARTGCDFASNTSSKPACDTGDCRSLLSCNGTIGLPPATLVEVSLEEGKPSFYDVSLVDGYNVPVSVRTRPADPKCSIEGCAKSVNAVCPPELQVVGRGDAVVACRSACLAFDLDVFCCRNSYGSPDKCGPSVYSRMFKEACPSYFSYAYDAAPSPIVHCSSAKDYVITFCPSKWAATAAHVASM